MVDGPYYKNPGIALVWPYVVRQACQLLRQCANQPPTLAEADATFYSDSTDLLYDNGLVCGQELSSWVAHLRLVDQKSLRGSKKGRN